jgi:hypothetical protein
LAKRRLAKCRLAKRRLAKRRLAKRRLAKRRLAKRRLAKRRSANRQDTHMPCIRFYLRSYRPIPLRDSISRPIARQAETTPLDRAILAFLFIPFYVNYFTFHFLHCLFVLSFFAFDALFRFQFHSLAQEEVTLNCFIYFSLLSLPNKNNTLEFTTEIGVV